MPNALLPTLVVALAAASMLHSGTAAAVGASVTFAVDNCNGALPGYEGALRKRALAIANEGTASAFVSCSVATNEADSTGNVGFAVYATNRGAEPQVLSCTFIDGVTAELAVLRPSLVAAVYRPKILAISPGQANVLLWTPDEFGLKRFTAYGSVSCSLPPGMELNIAGAAWEQPAETP